MCDLTQDVIKFLIKHSNIWIWRSVYGTNHIGEFIVHDPCKYTFDVIWDYTLFSEVRIHKYINYKQGSATTFSMKPGDSNVILSSDTIQWDIWLF